MDRHDIVMADDNNVLLVDPLPPSAQCALSEVAGDSGRIFFTHHAERWMQERRLTRQQVLRCLRHGRITEGTTRDVHGKRVVTLEVLSAGDVVTVVAALDNDRNGNLIVVITAYY